MSDEKTDSEVVAVELVEELAIEPLSLDADEKEDLADIKKDIDLTVVDALDNLKDNVEKNEKDENEEEAKDDEKDEKDEKECKDDDDDDEEDDDDGMENEFDLVGLPSKYDHVLSLQRIIPWKEEKECLILLLGCRMLMNQMVKAKLYQERVMTGNLSVNELRGMINSQGKEAEDWGSQMTEMKRVLLSEIRRNHALEKEMVELDKKIALLIKNRGDIQAVVARKEGLKRPKNLKTQTEVFDSRKLEIYQHLFYLLQTEPKYLGRLVFSMKEAQMEAFLEMVVLTLFGDAFTPREEYLILNLFRESIMREFQSLKDMKDFLSADSVVPKMIITYNKRKQGVEYIRDVLSGPIKVVIREDQNLEMNPRAIFQKMINEIEARTGEKSSLDRNLPDDKLKEVDELKVILRQRTKHLSSTCQVFFDAITRSVNKVPYGLRWICSQIYKLSKEKFPNSSRDESLKLVSYFVYYRFINLGIVTPDNFEVVDKELTMNVRVNLVAVAKVLQNLFNFSLFDEKTDKWMTSLNFWLEKRIEPIRKFLEKLIDVDEPGDHLQVDRYMELAQKTKPVVIISLKELFSTHQLIHENIKDLCEKDNDPLKIIMSDLGPPQDLGDEDDREFQLTLNNRFKEEITKVDAAEEISSQAKEEVIAIIRALPDIPEDAHLVKIMRLARTKAKDDGNDDLLKIVDSLQENLKKLEEDDIVDSRDRYRGFLREVTLEVSNRAAMRNQQKKEITRLQVVIKNMRAHQDFLKTQLDQYNEYIVDCRVKQMRPRKSKKKKKSKKAGNAILGPFKFSYSDLVKRKIIVDSEIPKISRKATKFFISSAEAGIFDVEARIAKVASETITLQLDDLLEKNFTGVDKIELPYITLDVNMTIYLLNKLFVKT